MLTCDHVNCDNIIDISIKHFRLCSTHTTQDINIPKFCTNHSIKMNEIYCIYRAMDIPEVLYNVIEWSSTNATKDQIFDYIVILSINIKYRKLYQECLKPVILGYGHMHYISILERILERLEKYLPQMYSYYKNLPIYYTRNRKGRKRYDYQQHWY